MDRVLHTYYRSSASYRVRIALNLKGLEARHVPVHLLKDGGEQFQPAFREVNPQALVPVLTEPGVRLSQSLAILEYLEEKYPGVPLLPADAVERARVRQIALAIACDIHPINNLRVLKYLTGPLGLSEEAKAEWVRHWVALGFDAIEKELQGAGWRDGFCVGDTPTLADCCLIPQIFNATRFGVEMSKYPILAAIDEKCQALPAFQLAHPSVQPDSV